MGYGVIGAGALEDLQGAVGLGCKPYPAGAEETNTLRFELCFERIYTSPLLDDLGKKRRFFRFFAALRMTRRKLSKIQLMVQDLAGVVEDGA